jgi:hypothetical protein
MKTRFQPIHAHASPPFSTYGFSLTTSTEQGESYFKTYRDHTGIAHKKSLDTSRPLLPMIRSSHLALLEKISRILQNLLTFNLDFFPHILSIYLIYITQLSCIGLHYTMSKSCTR